MFCTSADTEMYGKPLLCSLSVHRLLSTPKCVCVCVCVCVCFRGEVLTSNSSVTSADCPIN